MNKNLITLLFLVLPVSVAFAANHKHHTTKKQTQPPATQTNPQSNTQSSNLKENSPTILEQKQNQVKKINSLPLGLALYRPTYILPFYYTQTPYAAIYQGNTPDNQTVKRPELKGQFSVQLPLLDSLFGDKSLSLTAAYTQLFFWQVYASSQYFRETNYEPELFLSKKISDNQQLDFGVDHQSNGRGGDLERSWNRAYINYTFSGANWMVAVRPWVPIFRRQSSDIHNPDIYRYMGYGWVIGAYKFHNQTLSLMLRNNVESGFSRGAEELNWSVPIHGRVNLFVQVFSGYGQSLIEYNHYTNAIGVGFALNNWT